jgi:hypothetical protein
MNLFWSPLEYRNLQLPVIFGELWDPVNISQNCPLNCESLSLTIRTTFCAITSQYTMVTTDSTYFPLTGETTFHHLPITGTSTVITSTAYYNVALKCVGMLQMVSEHNWVDLRQQYWPFGLRNEDSLCFLWGMNWIFKNCLHGREVTAMTEAVRHRPLTSEVQVQSQLSPCEVCGGQRGTGTCFAPVIMHPVLRNYIHLHVSLTTNTSWRSLGTFQRATLFLEIGDHWTEKNLTFSSGYWDVIRNTTDAVDWRILWCAVGRSHVVQHLSVR